jgi:hypothetical protein
VSLQGNQIVIAWPTSLLDYLLEATDQLAAPSNWSPVPETPVVNGQLTTVTTTAQAENKFYRLRLH